MILLCFCTNIIFISQYFQIFWRNSADHKIVWNIFFFINVGSFMTPIFVLVTALTASVSLHKFSHLWDGRPNVSHHCISDILFVIILHLSHFHASLLTHVVVFWHLSTLVLHLLAKFHIVVCLLYYFIIHWKVWNFKTLFQHLQESPFWVFLSFFEPITAVSQSWCLQMFMWLWNLNAPSMWC